MVRVADSLDPETTPYLGPRRLYSREQLQEKFAFWGCRCWICGRDNVAMTKDHVKPRSKGGLDILANIRPACLSCNAHKKDIWPFIGTAILVRMFFAGQ